MVNLLEKWGMWVIVSTNFVPISLMVTLEFISLVQSSFFNLDVKLYNKDLEVWCKAQSSNLNEELGQVDTIFTDKTGTLTKNEMKLRSICSNGTE